ncbi:putative methyltransferase PMT23 [Sesamum alatum]|uniref:Methyltransferase PMT23 n=1 Tax=Sesamum alatum TaxID=300844 RepID=A0AAE1YU34_9LAMI|nr:putative methyltransferase PMT23 [Sesamum alatum]
MAISVPSILKERKYPFIFIFFLLLVFVTFLLVSDSQSPILIATNNLLRPEEPFSSNPKSSSQSSIPLSSDPTNPPVSGVTGDSSIPFSSDTKEGSTPLSSDPPASNAAIDSSIPFSSDVPKGSSENSTPLSSDPDNPPTSNATSDSSIPFSSDPRSSSESGASLSSSDSKNPPASNATSDSGNPFSSDPESSPVSNSSSESSVPFSEDPNNPTLSKASSDSEIGSSIPVSNASLGSGISSSNESATTNISSNPSTGHYTQVADIEWEPCKGAVAVDYIPCLDNWKAIKALRSRRHMEHRERHCPDPSPRCLVPLPEGYKIPVLWPKSRDMIWYNNVPHPKLVEYKKDQRWVMKKGEYFYFPGGGTQFRNGVNFYIDSIEKTLPGIEWGKKTRVILDVGCGVASFGGALLGRNIITMSLAPKDEHEAQIQFALERGIPAVLSVIGTRRLTFPDNSFDMIHCARCRVHWNADGGKPILELNRILRPGGYFVWSATPVYKKDEWHKKIWRSIVALTESICWTQVTRSFFRSSHIGVAIFQKPASSSCYQTRKENKPPLCDMSSRPNNSWYVPLDSCLVPLQSDVPKWPSAWPERLTDKPPRLPTETDSEEMYKGDTKHWSALVSEVYLGGLGVNWSSVRNVMDMNAGYGGFAAALINLQIWVMNVVPVPVQEPDTLPVIYDRGLIGIYHDWCESFNTYPRTYDLLHASSLLGNLTKRCDVIEVAAEIDRIVRPGGYLLVQDSTEVLTEVSPILKSLHWSVNIYQDQFLVGKKDFWRPA